MNAPSVFGRLIRNSGLLTQRVTRQETGSGGGTTLGEVYGQFQGLPGLRGLWYPGSVDNAGSLYDISGQGRTLSVGAGAPTVNMLNNNLAPYQFYGGGGVHTRPSEAGLQISGLETSIASSLRGLTMGGWFTVNNTGTRYGLMQKYTTGTNQRSYALWVFETGTVPQFYVSSNGTAVTTIGSSVAPLTAGAWYFIVGRYVPSTSVDIYVNGVKTTNTTTIPASIFNTSTSPFDIARFDAGSLLVGAMGLGFLCAAALPDTLLTYLFARSRALFGV